MAGTTQVKLEMAYTAADVRKEYDAAEKRALMAFFATPGYSAALERHDAKLCEVCADGTPMVALATRQWHDGTVDYCVRVCGRHAAHSSSGLWTMVALEFVK